MVRTGRWLLVALLAACSGSHDAKPSSSRETVTTSSERAAARLQRDLRGLRTRPPRAADGDDPLARRGRAAFAGMIQRFDADGDGTLDPDERKAMRDERAARMLSTVDGDGDGRLSRAELEAADNRRLRRLADDFAKIDADGDSMLSADEIAAAMPARGGPDGRGGRRGRGLRSRDSRPRQGQAPRHAAHKPEIRPGHDRIPAGGASRSRC
jgi:hypothetical protein